jgi:hypothetical protein
MNPHPKISLKEKSTQKIAEGRKQPLFIIPAPKLPEPPHLKFCVTSPCLDTPEKKKFVYDLIGDIRVVTVDRYLGSRDGFNARDFHSRCDKIGPTISLFKLKNGDVIGGFTCA